METPAPVTPQSEQITTSQAVGGIIGLFIGSMKGAGAGCAVAVATAPILGPFSLIFPVIGQSAGAVAGMTIGMKGIPHATMMVLGVLAGNLFPNDNGVSKST